MTLLKKKLVGLGSILLGGLAVAHGGAAGQTWEVVAGLLLVMVGATLLVAKVFRRNIHHDTVAPK